MRVSFVSQWYAPEFGDGGVPKEIVTALAGLGHDMQVLTGFPNYPDGKVFPGYRQRFHQRDVVDSVPVHRAPLYPSHDTRLLRRAANYLSFATSASMVAASTLPVADATLVYSSPITAALPAMAIKARRGTPFVLLVEDMWPQSVTASGMSQGSADGPAQRALHRLCDAIYRSAGAIAVTSPGMAELIADRGIDRDKVHFVPNWVDEDRYRPQPFDSRLKSSLGLTRPFTVMYAGNLGEAQGLETVIDAAALLREHADIDVALVGGGVAEPALRRRAADARLDNIHFLGSKPPAEMPSVLAVADLHLVSLRPTELFRRTLPSKIQSLLAAGQPVLGCVEGDAAALIERSGAGWTTTPGEAAELAAAVARIATVETASLAQRGAAGREYYLAHLSRRAGARALSDLLAGVRQTPGARGEDGR
ncbi:Glycosyltransferase involved in cell wall bisynthesis [Jatrophihabitans endophyticus]|uniref:Glycosyltransferase involved in cell wall bisynthesis n=1 Tax=Jatrophihabitans endophyticus TaxID=1206085 RepID=A0A1M5IPD4_9ACTN|nr:glycosyltransferase family 4 protein [Jatrophihabitans endophyticus]SHG29643.1 Glycosyltransferase involved in cell wall bisynthesis [Jatrophihabitans endophyticus]